MKLEKILLERTDISGFAQSVYKNVVPELDRLARNKFKSYKTKGEKENPSDPVQGAYDLVKQDISDYFSPKWFFRNKLEDLISKELQDFIKDEFGDDVKVRQYRIATKSVNFRVKFYNEIKGAKGQYKTYNLGYEQPPQFQIRIQIDPEKWDELWGSWFSDYLIENSTDQNIEEFIRSFMTTLVHEVTHAINDIKGDTHQNTALLKHGKAYNDKDLDAKIKQVYGQIDSNILHLSRTSEIQTFASEIAWELAQNIMTGREYKGNPEYAIEMLDYAIDDLAKGYFGSDSLIAKRDLIDANKDKFGPGGQKQLERIWKKLLGQVVRNLQSYRRKLESQIQK